MWYYLFIDTIKNNTPDAIILNLFCLLKERRLEIKLTQKSFSKRAGMGYEAYRRFENSGEITLKNLVLCAIALDSAEDFAGLFSRKSYQNMDVLLKTQEVKKRLRGSRNE